MPTLRALRLFAATAFIALALTTSARADIPAITKDTDRLACTKALAISGLSQSARRPINLDGLHAAISDGRLDTPPQPGDMIPRPAALSGGAASWSELVANDKGALTPKDRGSYLLWRFESDIDRVMILEAAGHAFVYVNSELRMGDPYGHGYVKLPVQIRKGTNQLIFAHASRGPFSAALVAPSSALIINTADITMPDVLADAAPSTEHHIGIPVLNATDKPQSVLISATQAGDTHAVESNRFILPPCSMLKVPAAFPASPKPDDKSITVRIRAVADSTETSCDLKPAVVSPTDRRKITFISEIDGSVQYYSVVPPIPSKDAAAPALVLSVHGASVEATNQASSYAPKRGVLIVCPTNRRPFGFDWEDWGRVDALEVLARARALFKTDPARQYVTGHSMGGHGTWQLSVLHPDLFAAAAPSAGWLSFDTYAGARGDDSKQAVDPVLSHFDRAAKSSDTIARMPELKGKGVYIIHGDADDNVPVSEARRAKDELTKLNIPFGYHEQPGAGHWWDLPEGEKKPPYTGAACVDWPPIFEMFKEHALSEADTKRSESSLTAARREVVWQSDTATSDKLRGPFKNAFNNRFVLVYATSGTLEENAWSFAKARFDAEQWWYRGNGTARLVSDKEFLANPDNFGNAILYGNTDANAAAKVLLKPAPFIVTRDTITAADSTLDGDLGILAVASSSALGKPRLVGLVGGTTLRGMRTVDRIPYFLAGVGIPDVAILSPDIWTKGVPAVRAAGSLDREDFTVRSAQP